MSGAEFTLAEQEAVARAWVECAGLGGLDLRVHVKDEVQAFIAAGSPRTDAHRFEYLRSGHEAYVIAEHLLRECGRSLDAVDRMLDFACGCGRIARFFVRALGPARVVCGEIDAEALQFVHETLAVRTIQSATDPGQVRFDADFDLVFVGSLFSHLPRPRFVAWLRALAAALRDDGVLVFTTHGEQVRGSYQASPSGFTFVPVSETSRLDRQEYGSAFVRPEVVLQLVREAGLSPIGYVEREVWDLQDVFVVGRDAAGAPRRLPGAPVLYGRIERAHLPRPGHAWIGGGTRLLRREAPLRDVRLVVDGVDIAAANLAPGVPQMVHGWGEERVTYEWYTEGDASALTPGLHTVCAVGTTAAGRREVFGARGLRA